MNNAMFMETTDGLKLDYMMTYSEMMINKAYDDQRLLLSVLDENTMLLEGGNLVPLNEGIISTIVEFLKKLVDSIANVIDRFVADIRKVVGMDSKFLADNKSVILNLKKIEKGDTVERYRNYDKAFEEFAKGTSGELMCNKKNFTFDEIKQNAEKWQTVEAFAKDQLSHLVGNDFDKNEQISLKNKIINYFAGEPHDIKDVELTNTAVGDNQARFEKMYNFCYKGYGAVLDSIKADKETINKTNDNVIEKLDAMKQQEKNNAPEEPPGQPSPAPAQNAGQPQESTFDSTMSYYFLDEDNPNPAVANDNKNTGEAKITHDDNKDPSKEEGDDKKEVDEKTKISNAVRSFYNGNMALMSAKMKLCMDVYKQSMKIMRWYVGRAKGSEEAAADKKDKETNTTEAPHVNTKEQ